MSTSPKRQGGQPHLAPSRPLTRAARGVALSAVLLLLAACGSQLPAGRTGASEGLGAQPSTGSASESGTAAGPGATDSGTGVLTGGSGSGTGGTASLHRGSAAGKAGGAGGSAQTTSVGGPGSAPLPGVKGKTPLLIGIDYQANTCKGFAALGATSSNCTLPSNAQIEQALQRLVNHVNSSGGLGGHPIKPAFYGYDVSNTNASSEAQRECVSFTQDRHIYATATIAYGGTILPDCLRRAHALVVAAGGPGAEIDDVVRQQYPLVYSAGILDLERAAVVYVNALLAKGFFTPGAKVGLIAQTPAPIQRVVNKVLIPMLKRHGVTITDQANVPPTYSVADAGANQRNMSSTVLRFQTEGITHVLFQEISGAAFFNFYAAEKSQDYYPRVGVTTNDYLVAMASPTANSIAPQEKVWANSVAIGWSPQSDTPNPPANATLNTCLKIFTGITRASVTALRLYTTCDELLLLQRAMSGTRGDTSPSAVAHGFDQVTNMLLAGTVGPANYAAGHKGGVATAAYMTWTKSCTCLRYSSAPFPVSQLEHE